MLGRVPAGDGIDLRLLEGALLPDRRHESGRLDERVFEKMILQILKTFTEFVSCSEVVAEAVGIPAERVRAMVADESIDLPDQLRAALLKRSS